MAHKFVIAICSSLINKSTNNHINKSSVGFHLRLPRGHPASAIFLIDFANYPISNFQSLINTSPNQQINTSPNQQSPIPSPPSGQKKAGHN